MIVQGIMSPPVFRFAPSPNGYLHLGHALSALINAEKACAAGGRLLLRIEDIDEARCRPEYEAAIYEDLAWLGIEWEEPVHRQSEHYDDYRAALARLDALDLVYPSFESRAEIAVVVAAREAKAPWPRDPDGVPLLPSPESWHWVKSIDLPHLLHVCGRSNSSEKISLSSPQLGHLQLNDLSVLKFAKPGQC